MHVFSCYVYSTSGTKISIKGGKAWFTLRVNDAISIVRKMSSLFISKCDHESSCLSFSYFIFSRFFKSKFFDLKKSVNGEIRVISQIIVLKASNILSKIV